MEEYEFIKNLGSGVYGQVIEAYEQRRDRRVAIKIFYHGESTSTSAEKEIHAHQFLRKRAGRSERNIATFYEWFKYQDRPCIVMELLGNDLLELMITNENGFELKQLQSIAKSVLLGLQFLHESRIIHADLKPNNIVVKDLESFECKIIDLGSCVWFEELSKWRMDYRQVQNHCYRAPEVFIKASFDEKIDVFSMGIVLAQLSSKVLLFKEDNTRKQLTKMVEYLGFPPKDVVMTSLVGILYFRAHQTSVSLKQLPGSEKVIPLSKKLEEFLSNHKDPNFFDFIKRCLDMDPVKRGSAKGLQSHPWLAEQKSRFFLSCAVM